MGPQGPTLTSGEAEARTENLPHSTLVQARGQGRKRDSTAGSALGSCWGIRGWTFRLGVHGTFPGFRAGGCGPRITPHPGGPPGSSGTSETLTACQFPLLNPGAAVLTQICADTHRAHQTQPIAPVTKPVCCPPSQPQEQPHSSRDLRVPGRKSVPRGGHWLWPDSAGPSCTYRE